jgi:hypothetical protein
MAGEDETPDQRPDGAAEEIADWGVEAVDWHLLLLGLVGRVSDSVVARCRDLLADQREAEVGQELVAGILAEGVPLFEVEVDFLGDAMGWTDAADEALAGITITQSGVPLGYGFAAYPSAEGSIPGHGGRADRAAIQSTSALPGTVGLWRAWRVSAGNRPPQQAAEVYVVEVEQDTDLIFVTGQVQRALVAAGQATARVEVYPAGLELPSYQRLARGQGELLWSRTPDPGVQIAVLFDEVDPTHGPRFSPDHVTVDGEELPRLVGYLQQGEPLLMTTARLGDVVNPARGKVVPMSFRTDGNWVWSDATTYYAETYGLLPDPALVAHVRAQKYVPPMVDAVAAHRAMAALQAPAAEEPAWTFGG